MPIFYKETIYTPNYALKFNNGSYCFIKIQPNSVQKLKFKNLIKFILIIIFNAELMRQKNRP